VTTPRPFDLAAIGAGLPVAGAREELADAARTGALVVTAPPGTGKTTFVPPLVADLVQGRTLVTQPRRVAVRAAARRIAQLDGSRLGERVGLTVRGERHVGPETRLEVLTPGVLLRRLLADPELGDVDAVILDEVHERSLDSDLLLGMLTEVRALRDDLTVVAMSATLDAAQVADLLGGARVVDVPAPLHPLRIEHEPGSAPRLDARGVTRDFLDHLARTTVEQQIQEDCDALVFVPGAREIDELVRRIRSRAPDLEVLPLHGRLPAREQDRARRGRADAEAGPARVVVSTALAESSLTVPGVRLVIDTGLSREVRRDRARDMTGLVTVSASRASADQRAGRAARQGPGLAVRAYSPTDDARMPAISPPEIASADLTDAALLVAAWGSPWAAPHDARDGAGGDDSAHVGAAGDPSLLPGLPLLTPPPAASATRAVEVLAGLGLVDADGRANALGRRVARLPVGVREARALLEGAERLAAPEAVAEVIAAVSDDHRAPDADLPRLLRELRAGRAPGADRWRRETSRLRRIADGAISSRGSTADADGADLPHDLPGKVLGLARPERIARLAATGGRSYLLAGGTRAALPEGSGLTGSTWLAIGEVQRAEGRAADGTGAVIRTAAPLEEDSALELAGPLLRATRRARLEGGKVTVREERCTGRDRAARDPGGRDCGGRRPRPRRTSPGARSRGSDLERFRAKPALAAGSAPSRARRSVARDGRRLAARSDRGLAAAGPAAAASRRAALAPRSDLRAAAPAALARGRAAGSARAGAARGALRLERTDRLSRPVGRGGIIGVLRGRRSGQARRRGEAPGALRPRGDPAPRGRPRAGALPPALPRAQAARRHRRPALLLGRAVPGGPQGDARALPQAPVARGPVDSARDRPHHAPREREALKTAR
jgi:ATP-dependent helicase HrpB